MAIKEGSRVYVLYDTYDPTDAEAMGYFQARAIVNEVATSPSYPRGRVRSYRITYDNGQTDRVRHLGHIGYGSKDIQIIKTTPHQMRFRDGSIGDVPLRSR